MTDQPSALTPPPRRPPRYFRNLIGGLVAVVECYVLVEIMWTVVNPSGPRLYERAWEWFTRCRDRLEYRLQVIATLRSIRRLPDQ